MGMGEQSKQNLLVVWLYISHKLGRLDALVLMREGTDTRDDDDDDPTHN